MRDARRSHGDGQRDGVPGPVPVTADHPGPPAGPLVARLTDRRLTVAAAESLTGGLLCAALVDVPGASLVVRGCVVAYASDVKSSVLGVDPQLLDRQGAVHPDVARQLAEGVCRVLTADLGVATTGVAGPDPADGEPVGSVYVAVAAPGLGAVTRVEHRSLDGDRAAIRAATVAAALSLLADVLASTPGG